MIRFGLALAFGLVYLPAQGTVWFPSDHDPAITPNGSGSTGFFPYSHGVSRMMAVYEHWDLLVPVGHAIDRIGFRAEGTLQSIGRTLQLEVRMGQTLNDASNCVAAFDTNYLSPPTTVFGPGLFAMPDMNNVLNPNPDGNMIWLTLTTPYVPDPNSNLVVEWRVIANSGGGGSFSYQLDRGTYVAPTIYNAQLCPHSGGRTATLRNRGGDIGGTYYADLSTGPANQAAILFLGVGAPLQPPIPLNTLFGGVTPSCTVDLPFVPLFSLNGTTNNGGSLTFVVPMPNDRIWNDVIVSAQVACLDFFSPGGITVSNAAQLQVGIDPAMTAIYAQGSTTATSGTLSRNYGVVTAFHHQ